MAGFIGTRASVVSSGAERKQHYNITTTTTSLTGLQYTPTKVHVYHNGIRLVDGTDYTATNGTSITLTNAAEDGDDVVVISYATFQVSDTVSAANGGTFAGNVTVSGDLNTSTVLPSSDDAKDLGTSAKRFQDAYLSGGVYLGGTGSANKLTDYEEGDWTPAIKFGGNNVGLTYSGRVGKYIKVGGLVTVYGVILMSAKGTSTGTVTLEGLPFTATEWTNYTSIEGGTIVCSFSQGVSSIYNPLMFSVQGGSTKAPAYSSNSSGVSLDDNVYDTKFSSTSSLRFSGSYYAGAS